MMDDGADVGGHTGGDVASKAWVAKLMRHGLETMCVEPLRADPHILVPHALEAETRRLLRAPGAAGPELWDMWLAASRAVEAFLESEAAAESQPPAHFQPLLRDLGRRLLSAVVVARVRLRDAAEEAAAADGAPEAREESDGGASARSDEGGGADVSAGGSEADGADEAREEARGVNEAPEEARDVLDGAVEAPGVGEEARDIGPGQAAQEEASGCDARDALAEALRAAAEVLDGAPAEEPPALRGVADEARCGPQLELLEALRCLRAEVFAAGEARPSSPGG